MPRRALKVCSEPRCPELTDSRYCAVHAAAYERKRGTRQARGYDTAYDRARRDWARRLNRGERVDCHAPICLEDERLIHRGSDFDLGHDDARNIRGPEHPRCNRSAGGKAAHMIP